MPKTRGGCDRQPPRFLLLLYNAGMSFEFAAIGHIESCYREKFGVPRQSGLVPEAWARLVLYPPYASDEALAGLEGFSHLWIIFVFHRHLQRDAGLSVRPPRLGGNARIGVFASRSSFRPNPIGLSAVEVVAIERAGDDRTLLLRGGDFVDGTPVLDIKPYLPYADSIAAARSGYAAQAPLPVLQVGFSTEALRQIEAAEATLPRLRTLIKQTLALDPRPAYHAGEGGRIYGMRLYDYDVKWRVAGNRAEVVALDAAVSMDQ